MAKKRLVVANWKMYIDSPDEAKKFVSTLRKRSAHFIGVDAWIAPTYPLIPVVAAAFSNKGKSSSPGGRVGAQAMSQFPAQALRTKVIVRPPVCPH